MWTLATIYPKRFWMSFDHFVDPNLPSVRRNFVEFLIFSRRDSMTFDFGVGRYPMEEVERLSEKLSTMAEL